MSTRKKKEAYEHLEDIMGQRVSLGLMLRSIRIGEEITQREFSEVLGISIQYLCDIEKGRRFVSPRAAAEFARKLGYSEESFVSLCLQDLLDREGLELTVNVEAA